MVWEHHQWDPHPTILTFKAWQINTDHNHTLSPVVIARNSITMNTKAPELLHSKLLPHPLHVLFGQLVVIVCAQEDFSQAQLPNCLQYFMDQKDADRFSNLLVLLSVPDSTIKPIVIRPFGASELPPGDVSGQILSQGLSD